MYIHVNDQRRPSGFTCCTLDIISSFEKNQEKHINHSIKIKYTCTNTYIIIIIIIIINNNFYLNYRERERPRDQAFELCLKLKGHVHTYIHTYIHPFIRKGILQFINFQLKMCLFMQIRSDSALT